MITGEMFVIFAGFFLFGCAFGMCAGAYLYYYHASNVVREAEQILEVGG